MQMVITTWKNTGETPIRSIDATFTFLDGKHQVIETQDYTLYAAFDSDPGVAPGEVYTTPNGEGFIYSGLHGKAASVDVTISSVSERSGM